MRVVISRRAEDDLAQIYTWLATQYDLGAAERVRVQAEGALVQLGRHPRLGPHPGWATRHNATSLRPKWSLINSSAGKVAILLCNM